MPTVRPLACTRCGAPLPQGALGASVTTQCPVCATQLQVVLFPAYDRTPAAGATPQLILSSGEAACFYHAEKRAVVPCDTCGRFLCALCDVKLGEKHFCPGCLQTAHEASALGPVERGRVRYDQVVWSLLILPLPFCLLLSPVTATAALVIALWKWRSAPSLVVNTRARLITGSIFALIELAIMTLFWAGAFGFRR